LAEKVTEENKGKHHIGDFLPPEELEKFVERIKAARGETAAAGERVAIQVTTLLKTTIRSF